MLVDYKNANIHTIPVGSYQNAENIVLKPGVNEVDETKWTEALKRCPDVVKMIDDGVIVVKSEKSADENLSKFSQKEALEIVKSTFDIPLMQKWFMAEKREPVKAAINAQVASIKAPAKKDEDKKE